MCRKTQAVLDILFRDRTVLRDGAGSPHRRYQELYPAVSSHYKHPPLGTRWGQHSRYSGWGRHTNFKNMPDSPGFLSKVMEATNACWGERLFQLRC